MIPPVLSPIEPRALPSALLRGRRVRDAPEQLESLLRERYAADQVVLTGSGTQALQLAITIARGTNAADPLALPGYGCYDLATATIGARTRVRLYDLDPATLGPDFASLERVLEQCPVAVVAPYYGVPVDWDRVRALAETFGATIIEDAAQGHGADWRGRRLGSLGELSILSFGRGKGWTGGHGGALLLRGTLAGSPAPDLASPAGGFVGPLTLAAQWLFTRPALYRLPASVPALGLGETRYRRPVLPTAMDPATAFLVLRNDAASVAEIPRRRLAADEYDRLCREARIATVRLPEGATRGALRYPVLVPPEKRRSADLRTLGALPAYPRPLAELPALRPVLDNGSEAAPGARRLADQLLTLPTHSQVSPRLRQRVVAQLERRL